MKAFSACVLLVLLTGCTSPYQQALESKQPVRPTPPVTPADERALAPYNNDLFR